MKTLFRNIAADGAASWHPTETAARAAVRVDLLRGGMPFREIAKPVEIPTGSKKALAAFLNSLSADR